MRTRFAITIAALAIVVAAPCPAQQSAAAATAPAPTSNAITAIDIQSSTWRGMRLDVAYELVPGTGTTTLGARWMRKNGRALAFNAVSTAIAPGTRRVTLATTHRGMLPPPNEIIMHVEMRGASGALAQYDCQLALVNPDGQLAWAADIASKRPVRWTNRRCTKR